MNQQSIFTYSDSCTFEHSSVESQVTRCSNCVSTEFTFTCNLPSISYGSTFGGAPVEHGGNDYAQWCREIGFDGPASVTSSTEFVNGKLFWCNFYDDRDYHWCDWTDGFWKDSTLDSNGNANRIKQLICTKGNELIYFRLF